MTPQLQLVRIPLSEYSNYRYEVIFNAYKWDPQVEDENTISKYAVLISKETAKLLEAWAERLSEETMQMEEALICAPQLAKELRLPRKIVVNLQRVSGYRRDRHIRLMRFDFHPTPSGWAVSEVNSDVPGGLAEASVLPRIAARFFPGYVARHHVADQLLEAFRQRIRKSGVVAFVHATSYADDRQVMQFLGDHFEKAGYSAILAAPDHIRWNNGEAYSIIEGHEGRLDGVVRFFPLEWLANLPRKSGWQGYFDGETPSCNHPVSILTQSKRLPLVWDRLGVEVPAWRSLLPETVDPRAVARGDGAWILKPALGRVGEGVSIREALSSKEYAQICKAARRSPKVWVAQRRFQSAPLAVAGEAYHLCVGMFTVDGKCAGAYGRISPYPCIDARAQDIPLLVSEKGEGDGQPEHL